MSDDSAFPSMTALLGLLAVAGYQNRDKIADMLGMHGGAPAPAGAQPLPSPAQPMPNPMPNQGGGFGGGFGGAPQGQQGGGFGGLGGLLGGLAGAGGAGSFLNGGIGQLINHFDQNGHGQTAQSWVDAGPNQPIAPNHLEQAIGPDVLTTLQQRTGLSREDLLQRLSNTLPHAVDQYTPNGRMPT